MLRTSSPQSFFRLLGSALLSSALSISCSPSAPPCAPEQTAQTPVVPVPSAEKPPQPKAHLSLWNEGTSRRAITEFVTKVTTPGTPDFIPEAERIAVFDNDGTLWSEQPMYVQLAFAFDRVKALAPQHPEWKTEQPFAAVLSGDKKTLETAGTAGLLKIVLATHGGMSSDEFRHLVLEWLKTARHPKYNRLYTELTYAPMVELLGYLRAHGFKTFIVSGGGVAFMRPWVEAAYGIPPEQVVGSRIKTAWKAVDGKGTLQRLPKIDLIDDGPDKPVGIQEMIGRQPVFAAGNSDGDLQMLQWTAQNNRPSISLIVHHTDAVREVAYDRQSHVGKLDKALDMAEKDGWLVVDMKNDWKTVFAFESAAE